MAILDLTALVGTVFGAVALAGWARRGGDPEARLRRGGVVLIAVGLAGVAATMLLGR